MRGKTSMVHTSGTTGEYFFAGRSKSLSSKAAVDERTGGVALGYVEDAFEATCLREALRRRQGTMLAGFFSVLPG
ncbi:MAG: hypothetical protein ABL983_18675 [Nitrospira sp.]